MPMVAAAPFRHQPGPLPSGDSRRPEIGVLSGWPLTQASGAEDGRASVYPFGLP